MLIGKRQIFIRFAGCNINCLYCDTIDSKSLDNGKYMSFEELNDKIQSLMTDDFHSLEITGGEPLLHSDYIHDFLQKYPYPAMLETNATVPDAMHQLKDLIDIVSMDIKLPEHFRSNEQWKKVYSEELESIRIMEEDNISYYLKIVVSDTTPLDVISDILTDLKSLCSKDVDLIVQPVSPMSKWSDKKHLFEISELIGANKNIIQTGFVSGEMLSELYSNAKVFVFPSEAEGMPMCLLEALSYNTKCIVSDIPENTEVAKDYAVSFKTADVGDLKEKLVELLDDSIQVKDNSRKYIEENYSWDNAMKKTLDLYTKILS